MALIVETGAVVAGADSYITSADASAFLDSVYSEYDTKASAYLGLSANRRDVILRQAAYALDRKYRKRWKGSKTVQTQSLDWPRYNVQDEDGLDVPSTTIPRRMQRAQCEIAMRIADGDDIFEDQAHGGRVKSEEVDVISTSYFADASTETVFEGVDALLSGLLENENRIVRA